MAKYKGKADSKQGSEPCAGILLVNLGTPDAPTRSALRRYLKEFLSDPRVIELPKFIWWFILNGFILNTRPGKSARAYQKIWTENGSPLLDFSLGQTSAVQAKLRSQVKGKAIVELAMRYGNPSIQSGLDNLRDQGAERLLVFPLYPQYSATTTASVFDAVADVLKTWRLLPELRVINHYNDHPAYIAALVESIRRHWAENGRADKLLFSFHGIPKHYSAAGDPYHDECDKTTRLVVEQLQLQEHEYLLAFQSRFGSKEWLQPYTDETLRQWATDGVNHVQIICPGFSSDCLETMEEINIQNRDFFLQAGGEEYSYIPALNDQADHIDAICEIILQHGQGWPEFSEE